MKFQTGCRDIEIRKFEVGAKTQFLYPVSFLLKSSPIKGVIIDNLPDFNLTLVGHEKWKHEQKTNLYLLKNIPNLLIIPNISGTDSSNGVQMSLLSISNPFTNLWNSLDFSLIVNNVTSARDEYSSQIYKKEKLFCNANFLLLCLKEKERQKLIFNKYPFSFRWPRTNKENLFP